MLLADFPDNARDIAHLVGEAEYKALRAQVLDSGERVDGRKHTEVRPITIDLGILPRAHGSALFTRGQTQALVAMTLGTANDVQRLDSIDDPAEVSKSFMLHYNFPPFSTGEVRPVRGTTRTPFASSPTCWSRTDPHRWRPCAAGRSLCSTVASRRTLRSPVSQWG
jgi:polyribonucleotide nucleotidyltransferase